jgi:hypothetical protein
MSYVIDIVEKLVKGAVSFSIKRDSEAPRYIDAVMFRNEQSALTKIREITQKEIIPLQEKVNSYSSLKRILWLGDNKLVQSICAFFEKMGFQTKVTDIGEEDFWLLDAEKEIAIVEVKGLNNNLTREDIAKADTHREARDVPHMTGLLIANTFMTAQSIEKKNEAFSTNVIEKAVHSNWVITRTLDLFNIYDYMEQNNLSYTWLLNLLIGKKGWLTMQNNKIAFKEE